MPKNVREKDEKCTVCLFYSQFNQRSQGIQVFSCSGGKFLYLVHGIYLREKANSLSLFFFYHILSFLSTFLYLLWYFFRCSWALGTHREKECNKICLLFSPLQIFPGNSDQNTAQVNMFWKSIKTNSIRIVPLAGYEGRNKCMRADVIGCLDDLQMSSWAVCQHNSSGVQRVAKLPHLASVVHSSRPGDNFHLWSVHSKPLYHASETGLFQFLPNSDLCRQYDTFKVIIQCSNFYL